MRENKPTDTEREGKELRRILYLIRYYDGCINDYAGYSKKNPEAERLSVCQNKLRRLIAEARAMMESGDPYDPAKLPQGMLANGDESLSASKCDQAEVTTA